MIRIKIDVTKLDKTAFFQGKNGALWCDLALWETPNDKFGNDYRVNQDLGKERRQNGERGAIVGNGKAFTNGNAGATGGRPQQASQSMYEDEGPRHQPTQESKDDSIPF